MQKLGSKKLAILLLIWTLSLIAALAIYGLGPVMHLASPLPYAEKAFSGHKYVGIKNDPSPTVVFSGKPQQIGSMDMVMKFKILKFSQWANIFSTAPRNKGIRFELYGKPGEAIGGSLIVGDYLTDKYSVFEVSKYFELNKEYELQITIDYWGKMSVWLDGKHINERSGVTSTLSNIILGSGFDEQRPFLGDVRLDSLRISVIDEEEGQRGADYSSSYRNAEKIYYLLGPLMVMVNIMAAFRMFFYIWYE